MGQPQYNPRALAYAASKLGRATGFPTKGTDTDSGPGPAGMPPSKPAGAGHACGGPEGCPLEKMLRAKGVI